MGPRGGRRRGPAGECTSAALAATACTVGDCVSIAGVCTCVAHTHSLAQHVRIHDTSFRVFARAQMRAIANAQSRSRQHCAALPRHARHAFADTLARGILRILDRRRYAYVFCDHASRERVCDSAHARVNVNAFELLSLHCARRRPECAYAAAAHACMRSAHAHDAGCACTTVPVTALRCSLRSAHARALTRRS